MECNLAACSHWSGRNATLISKYGKHTFPMAPPSTLTREASVFKSNYFTSILGSHSTGLKGRGLTSTSKSPIKFIPSSQSEVSKRQVFETRLLSLAALRRVTVFAIICLEWRTLGNRTRCYEHLPDSCRQVSRSGGGEMLPLFQKSVVTAQACRGKDTTKTYWA